MTYVHIFLIPDTPQWEDLRNIDTKSTFSVAEFYKDDICKCKALLDANEVSEQSASEHALIT